MALEETYPVSLIKQADLSPSGETRKSFDLPASAALVTNSTEVIYEARQLTAEVYLMKGYVTPDQITDDRTIVEEVDPYVPDSEYFVATSDTSEVVASTRKIRYNPEKGADSFPVWKHRELFDEDKVELVKGLGLENCVEISALAKKYKADTEGLAALRLYRALIQDALEVGEDGQPKDKVFLMALSPKLYTQLTTYFDGAIKRIGPNLDYPGEEVVPAMMQPLEGMVEVVDAANRDDNPDKDTHAFIADFILSEATGKIVHPELVEALKRNGMQETLQKYTISEQAEVLASPGGWKKNALRVGLVGATIGALIFEQGPGNEALRAGVMFDVLDNTQSALASGGAVAAVTMAIESGTGGLIALGLHEEKGAVKRVIQRFKRKSTPELDEDGKVVEKERTLSTKAGDLALAVSIGPGIAMTKRHLQEAEPKMGNDIKRLLGYSAVGSVLSGGIAYLITGGVQQADKVGLGTPAEYIADYGGDVRTWAGILGLIYGAKGIKKISGNFRKNKSSDSPGSLND